MSELIRRGRRLAAVALALGYAVLAHSTNLAGGAATLGTLVALAPLLLAALLLAWHARHRHAMLVVFGIGCGALLANWSMLSHHYSRIYWLEHAGTEFILCLTFGRTLMPGREPMCTHFARVIHGSITPAVARYSRQVTLAWVVFFGAMAASSTILFLTTPLSTWSAFANFFTAPLIASMFAIEYLLRRRLHPHMQHAHILDAVKAFWKIPVG